MVKQYSEGGIRRVGIVFAGGPAPGANAVISAAAVSLLDSGRDVVGFVGGYRNLAQYDPFCHRLTRGEDYLEFQLSDVTGIRSSRGVIIGTSRTNPGRDIEKFEDLEDETKVGPLRNVYFALVDMGIDALISIGGDDTLRTANLLYEFQKRLAPEAKRIQVVHLPKTIDNDYSGIDFTFGYFTAVEALAKEMRNLRADAAATGSWFIAEAMGRKSGWLAYGVGIAGEANLILSVEDLTDESGLLFDETWVDEETGETHTRRALDENALADQIVDLMVSREQELGKPFGTVVLAEGLAEWLPKKRIEHAGRDQFGHIDLSVLHLGNLVAGLVARRYQERMKRKRKVNGIQVGYEARCSPAHAYDIMLGSQLGIGAYKALVDLGLNGHMVAVKGQLELTYVPFEDLVDPETLRTENRFIQPGSDFHQLARFLEDRTERVPIPGTGTQAPTSL